MSEKPKSIPFHQVIAHPSRMSPATRRAFIACGDDEVIEWCKKNAPDEYASTMKEIREELKEMFE